MTSNTMLDILNTSTNDIAAVADAFGQAADAAAAAYTFAEYRAAKSAATLRNQRAALDAFAQFLNGIRGDAVAPVTGEMMTTSPTAWAGVTWGIIKSWRAAMLNTGCAIGTINNRLAHVRTYAAMASQAGIIPADKAAHIAAVRGIKHSAGIKIDEKRPRTRKGDKKAAAVALSSEQRAQLKRPTDDSAQAVRDAVIMTILLDHGLRVGELAELRVDAIDFDSGMMVFYRPKVNMTQRHRMTSDTLSILRRYMAMRPADAGPLLLVASNRRGKLLPRPMSIRAIAQRVALVGSLVGADGLSPHDCRHSWATVAAASGTGVFALRDAGGWKSVAMPSRYVAAADIANDGVILYR